MNNVITILFFFSLLIPGASYCQHPNYENSINNYIHQYVQAHEVVKGNDKKRLQFYPANKRFCVKATFKLTPDSEWFLMNTSGTVKKQYRVYGTITFVLNDTILHLNIYQSKTLLTSAEYSTYLFIPFTDKTTGFDTYGGGRYIDLRIEDLKNDSFLLDFNKAYNPYCAYTTGYNCPIPPAENDLPVAITAGEKNYGKH